MPARPSLKFLAAVLVAGLLATAANAAAQQRQQELPHDQEDGGGSTLPPSLLEPKSDWGCEVLLCLANPGSPTEFAECVAPIEKLWKELAKGRSFPKCAMGGGENGNYANQRGNFIDVYVDGKLYKTINWRTGGETPPPGGGGRDDDKPVQQIR
ncbi:hypothetical protein [Xanthomonas axonopodis]|uniref:hypothetical protein n=1 Tax=Xanthomonas axonopodis TaxID=53413 RepID=UPI003555FD1B